MGRFNRGTTRSPLLLAFWLLLSMGPSSQSQAQAQRNISFNVLEDNNGTDSLSTTMELPAASAAPAELPPLPTVQVQPSTSCIHDRKIPYDATRHRPVYKVGVLAIRGFDAAYSEFNRTYVDYLSATAGQRFDPPVQFELKPMNFRSMFSDTAASEVDFIYVNPSAFSCIESEFTAHSLVSQVSRRKISGNVYHLKKFGGVIFRRHDRTDIQTMQDVPGKVVAAASISGLGSGQMQFLAMQQAGLSYINDPKQLVFTSNQGKVVNGVLNGEFDVGFVRTDQIERTKDSNGTLVDTAAFAILDPVPGLNIDGEPFPFEATTPLYPEWNIAALAHVPVDVSEALQDAMLSLADHAKVISDLQECMDDFNSTTICDYELIPKARCDTTPEIAEIAFDASNKGKYSSWTTTLSYMQLRSMQEQTGFIQMDPDDNKWKCTRSSTIYDAIVCPSGYYKETEEEVDTACETQGLVCKEGYQCICGPCVKIVECVDAVSIGSKCVPYRIFLPALLIPFFFLCAIAVHFYVEYRRKQADSVWLVQAEELTFEEPAKVLGRGTFGYVLLAEYRGTKVAVKKVLPPPKDCRRSKKKFTMHDGTASPGNYSLSEQLDLESGHPGRTSPGYKSMGSKELTNSLDVSLQRAKNNPGLRSMASRLVSLTGSTLGTGNASKKHTFKQLKADFVLEMRHLAKLRHPCITTVMGAVVSKDSEPMLVMEHMNRGSLYDVLRDDKIELDLDEHIMPILQDIAQGIRFLHAATPKVVHGDIKAKNVLIDTNFRAKVTDFGLSAKKQDSASGTPYWMAPELLRGEGENTEKSDIYALGVLLYEVFSGQNPYEGENYAEVLKQICDPKVNKRPPIPDNCSIKIGELMKDCVSATPHFRPTAEHIDLTLRVEGSVKERVCKLEKLNNDLAVANTRIEEASKMQLEHFACMSHEIRTPLNCIVGLSSLMEEGGDLTPSQGEHVGMISSSSALLQSIVDDVLDYSKLQSGNAEVDIKESDIQQVVADLVKSMRASVIATKRNLTFSTHFGPTVTQHIQTDGRRLLQIMFNLVSNAVKFSKNNGVVEVRIDICNRVEPMGAPRKSESDEDEPKEQERKPLVKFAFPVIRFTVKDYGKGIEKKNFNRIFQPFTQTNSGVSNIDGGTGLGLAITEKLIRALGGDIRVDSRLQQWTEFTVDLPYEGPPASPHQMDGKFANSEIFLVGSDHYVSDAFDFFHMSRTVYPTMKNFEAALQSTPKASVRDSACLCLVKSELFDPETAKHLSRAYGIKFIVTGPASGLHESVRHFTTLREMIPFVFVSELAALVKEIREMSKSQVGISMDSNHMAHAPCDLTKLRILCAEDNKVNQKILMRMLKRLGVPTVVMMENGKLAVVKEAEEEFDVILMDMQMPVMDGIDATKLIVAREGGHKKPLIIFVTAHVSASFEAKCLECGATAYLPKPYTLPVLKETLLGVAEQLQADDLVVDHQRHSPDASLFSLDEGTHE